MQPQDIKDSTHLKWWSEKKEIWDIIKVQEKVDDSVRRELQRSNPFKAKECGRESCLVCERGSGIDCRTRGCIYEMQCESCRRKYRGQTGNSIKERTEQHFDDWEDEETSSPLHRHSQLFQNGEQFPVSIKILKRCFGDATERKITEAVLIDKLSTEETMNGENEWTYVKLNKVSTTYWRQISIAWNMTSDQYEWRHFNARHKR